MSELDQLLLKAYRNARKNKRATADQIRFERNYVLNLAELKAEIENRTYEPSRGIAFITEKPVIREIFAAPFRDRVVHHLIFDLVGDWWDRQFIYDSYSCRKNKGNLFGIKRMYHHMATVSNNFHDETYILKLDLQGYFMSLSRQKLYDLAFAGLNKQFPNHDQKYKLLKFLWGKIIFDDPTVDVRKKASWYQLQTKLPHSKSLFYAKPGYGIVIGNLTSQLLSNIIGNQIDRFIVFELGFKHYGRYVDDFYLVDNDREKLQAAIPKIDNYLKTLGLTLHPQKRVLREINQGIDYLGATLYPYRIHPGKRLKTNYLDAAFRGDDLQSYHGAMCHFKHYKLTHKEKNHEN